MLFRSPVLRAALRGDLGVTASEYGIIGPHVDLQGGGESIEARCPVELRRLPRRSVLRRGKTHGVTGRVEPLFGEDPGHGVMSVAVIGRPTPDRDHDVRPNGTDHGDHIAEE